MHRRFALKLQRLGNVAHGVAQAQQGQANRLVGQPEQRQQHQQRTSQQGQELAGNMVAHIGKTGLHAAHARLSLTLSCLEQFFAAVGGSFALA